MTVCLFGCLLEGVWKYYWLELYEKKQMSRGPSKIPDLIWIII